MVSSVAFDSVARLPLAGDNVAIAVRRLEAGTLIEGPELVLDFTVMEGHRFALRPIAPGEALLSWELPFGTAIRAIEPGQYVCNQSMLEALGGRQLDFALPGAANFVDRIDTYHLDQASFVPGAALARAQVPGTFAGYARPGGRGAGTRNYIVVLGTSSLTGSYARLLAGRTHSKAAAQEHIDGVVAVAHTEGSGGALNNRELLLRSLAGFATHANVAAVLLVDYGNEAINNRVLTEYMAHNGYPLDQVPHRLLSLKGRFEAMLAVGQRQIEAWLEPVGKAERTAQPLARLKLALQCGGSDAFSGISGNPLAAWAARELIRHGGSANLAETDELMGAEPYVLQRVRDRPTAEYFLALVERFKERAAWHGATAEGNPSGGNKYRGLYNIALKSIGAAMKRHPQVRLDYAIDYGAPMTEPGYYFMDSPGNDLESIAGQVAAGCNMIYFVTGNGSITNFPFVPTIKIVTTTQRYQMLAADMDVNAGAYLDGTPMDQLGGELFARTLAAAGGAYTKGERAGHAQVQIWRDWPQADASQLAALEAQAQPAGRAVAVAPAAAPNFSFAALSTPRGLATDQVGLVLPTSLCSGQIARLTAERLNDERLGREQGLARFVAPVHTEGCGVSGGAEDIYTRTLMGYLTHPLVGPAVLMEHGCEKTHNDFMRHQLQDLGLDAGRYGWVSIQLDGGIDQVVHKTRQLFVQQLARLAPPTVEHGDLGALRLGLLSSGPLPQAAALALAQLGRWVAGAGGRVVVPHNAGLLASDVFCRTLLGGQSTAPTLAHGQRLEGGGLHIMEAPTEHWVETLTGLGATGVELMLAHVGEHPLQTHPLVPLAQVSALEEAGALFGADLDLMLVGAEGEWAGQLLELIGRMAGRAYVPKLVALGNSDFQITRGLLGISM